MESGRNGVEVLGSDEEWWGMVGSGGEWWGVLGRGGEIRVGKMRGQEKSVGECWGGEGRGENAEMSPIDITHFNRAAQVSVV